MNKSSILVFIALSSAITNASILPRPKIEFPEGLTCCRAYTEANYWGDYQDFCTPYDSSLPKEW